MTTDIYEKRTRQWLNDTVIDLNLCPFAHKPMRDNSVHFCTCKVTDSVVLIERVSIELEYLLNHPEIETSIIILPVGLDDFYYYCDFLKKAENALVKQGYEGAFQLAGFHPQYLFAGESEDDASHFTNRSPYPLIHILREQSLELLLERFPDSDMIPVNNIKKLRSLTKNELKRLYPYCFK